MAQTKRGAILIACKKIGVTTSEYNKKAQSGLKWCVLCRKWHDLSEFGKDSSRWDGLASSCRDSINSKQRDSYVPKPGPEPGRALVDPRNGDVKQARRRVNYLVESSLIPHPNELACTDCGHIWEKGRRRHEYDHHLGYGGEHHEHVEPVCTRCHHKRERNRGRQ